MAGHRITAGFATIGQGAGPMIVTQRAGLFADHGLDVEIRMMHAGSRVVKGLMEGEIQFGNLAAPSLLRAVLLGEADAVFVSGGINQQFLIGRPGIRDRKQLSGKKIAIAGDGGFSDLLVRFVIEQLERQGIGNIQAIPIVEKKIKVLIEGECDAAIFSPPLAIIAKRQGCHFVSILRSTA